MMTFIEPTTRKCNECQLCCRLLPIDSGTKPMVDELLPRLIEAGLATSQDFDGMVDDFDKPSATTCPHQCGTGCAIYAKRPFGCRTWTCAWLADKLPTSIGRPDRVHYVVDTVPDALGIDDGSGNEFHVPCVQIWVDPHYPDAHKDPSLRAYLAALAKDHGMAAMIRYSSGEGFALFAPAMTGGDWIERKGDKYSKLTLSERLEKIL